MKRSMPLASLLFQICSICARRMALDMACAPFRPSREASQALHCGEPGSAVGARSRGVNGERVRALRHQQCYSQEELGRRAGISKQTLQRAERGEPLNPGSVRALCAYFGETPEALGLAVRGVAPGAGLAWPTLPAMDWSGAGGMMTRPVPIDDIVLQGCAALNRSLWQAF